MVKHTNCLSVFDHFVGLALKGLTDALPELWKYRILNCRENLMGLCIFDHDLIKINKLYCLNAMVNRELYQIQVSEKYKKPTSRLYYEG